MVARIFGRRPAAPAPVHRRDWQGYRDLRHAKTIPERLALLRPMVTGTPRPHPGAAAELAKLLFDCLGPTPAAIQELQRVADALAGSGDPQADRVRATLACALCEISDCAEAVAIMGPILERRGPPAYDLASVALVEQLLLFGLDAGRIAADCHALMTAQPRDQQGFEALILDRRVSVALVGNSPVEVGRGLGPQIEASDVVIRFNNYSGDAVHEADYGRLSHVWARAATHTTVWRRAPTSYDFVVFTGVDRRFHGPKFWDVLEATRAGARAAFVPTRLYVDLVGRLGFPPSGGMQLLWWLRSVRGRFADNNVRAYGFSMDDQADNASTHYFADLTARPSYWHNWPAEGAFLRKCILD